MGIRSAPIVNPMLAELMANERNPVEEFAADQASAKGVWSVGVAHADLLKHGRVVKLAYAHYTLTKAIHKAACPRCGEMIRAGYGHDVFRRLDRQMNSRGLTTHFVKFTRLRKVNSSGEL